MGGARGFVAFVGEVGAGRTTGVEGLEEFAVMEARDRVWMVILRSNFTIHTCN